MKGLRLYKYEKLCSRKLIDQMFAAKNNVNQPALAKLK